MFKLIKTSGMKIYQKLKEVILPLLPKSSNLLPISIGGACLAGNIIRRHLKIYPYALPFDNIRISFEGVIDCINNNFENFFPEKPWQVEKLGKWSVYRGKYSSFWHHNIENLEIQQAFQRRFERFINLLKGKKPILFVRTIISQNPEQELQQIKFFKESLQKKYPNLKYKTLFIIHGQNMGTKQIKWADPEVMVFCAQPEQKEGILHLHNYQKSYEKIIKFAMSPKNWQSQSGADIKNFKIGNDIWLVQEIPVIK